MKNLLLLRKNGYFWDCVSKQLVYIAPESMEINMDFDKDTAESHVNCKCGDGKLIVLELTEDTKIYSDRSMFETNQPIPDAIVEIPMKKIGSYADSRMFFDHSDIRFKSYIWTDNGCDIIVHNHIRIKFDKIDELIKNDRPWPLMWNTKIVSDFLIDTYCSEEDCIAHHEYDIVDEEGNRKHIVGAALKVELTESQQKLVKDFCNLAKKMKDAHIALTYNTEDDQMACYNTESSVSDGGELTDIINYMTPLDINVDWYSEEFQILLK